MGGAAVLCYNFDGAVDVVAIPGCVNWTWLLLVPLARETGRWLLDWLRGYLRAQPPVLARVHLLSDGLVALPRFLGISAKSSRVPGPNHKHDKYKVMLNWTKLKTHFCFSSRCKGPMF